MARGFEPTLTWSAHFIADRRFRAAVDDYLDARRRGHRRVRCGDARARALPRPAQSRATREDHHLALAAGRARVVSARSSRRSMSRPACSPPAATCRRSGCWPPTGAASSRGIRPGSRCSGGRPTRAPCCFPRSFAARAASPRRCATAASTSPSTGISAASSRPARAPRPQSVGTWITAEMMDAYVELHRRGYAHSIETWRGGRAGGRPLRRAARRRVLRRIHVQPGAGRLEGRAGAARGGLPGRRHRRHRLPDGLGPPGNPWAAGAFRAPASRRCCGSTCCDPRRCRCREPTPPPQSG